jgi:hypothetical protein
MSAEYSRVALTEGVKKMIFVRTWQMTHLEVAIVRIWKRIFKQSILMFRK